MHKFFVEPQYIVDNVATIRGDDAKHIYKVLRLLVNDEISINNCLGEEYIGNIINLSKDKVEVKIMQKLDINNESLLNITLFQGMPKSSKMDMIIQKNTEIGVKRIVPIITERVVVKADLNKFKKMDRYKRIAREACKQCKRSLIPEISNPVKFEDFLELLNEEDLIIVPYENEKKCGIKKLVKEIDRDVKNIAIVIGPEGGFENSEIEKLKEKGAYIISLGPRILRTETAGFVVGSIIMYEFGDLGGNI